MTSQPTPEAATAWLEANTCEIVFFHAAYPLAESELGFVQAVAAETPCVVLAGKPSVAEAMAAARAGVGEYLEPPFAQAALDALLVRLWGEPGAAAAAEEAQQRGCTAIIGTSDRMTKVFALIKKVCDTDTTVLIRGESGTGKELIAQALHYEGARRSGPFIAVNCGAIPGELLESELFGHEKGAFTHAIRTRMGRFELAHGGTVFLDEISEMSPMLQVKLLRVLQERKFERIGGTRTIESDFRVVAATNRDLDQEVAAGRFREDLYYRLNVIPIEAPPLRERKGDIALLIDHFIGKFNRVRQKKISGVTPEAMRLLLHYPWPGNVRELENTVERMVILASGRELAVEDLPDRLLGTLPAATAAQDVHEIPAEGFFLNEVVADFEKRLIVQALDQTGGVRNRAAKLLNVNRTTLIEKMKRFGLMQSENSA
ncbi:MAG TPA: sigma-54 dependent transcriptional regulator [Desulfurivibrionaceae bacterium]|nr:sigma-54 dependent transcriptional regulator [Desulfurivibrionaceae bacterium]